VDCASGNSPERSGISVNQGRYGSASIELAQGWVANRARCVVLSRKLSRRCQRYKGIARAPPEKCRVGVKVRSCCPLFPPPPLRYLPPNFLLSPFPTFFLFCLFRLLGERSSSQQDVNPLTPQPGIFWRPREPRMAFIAWQRRDKFPARNSQAPIAPPSLSQSSMRS